MANAKKCDICGKYFDAPETSPYRLDYDDNFNFIRLHRAKNGKDDRPDDIWIHFDSCDECYQDMLDYILSNAAESAK